MGGWAGGRVGVRFGRLLVRLLRVCKSRRVRGARGTRCRGCADGRAVTPSQLAGTQKDVCGYAVSQRAQASPCWRRLTTVNAPTLTKTLTTRTMTSDHVLLLLVVVVAAFVCLFVVCGD